MRDEHDRGGGRHRTEGRSGREGREHCGSHHGAHGAQTFRRARVLAFLEQLQGRRATLARQLGEPEFEAIKPVISGELKALEHVIEEYILLFDLQEVDQHRRED
ncbi:hypothetical protein [Cohnella terricola]|uniref:Uncharacterized protein n=1 Tax=Cohnella terricola TaxID=1289167 RepID=A0A559JQ02_9BACL|nr:hypothetical protein [Cohnella terricola]TVY01933.1 hypothetical protein FPZ45_05665 [Cohnella terricola]